MRRNNYLLLFGSLFLIFSCTNKELNLQKTKDEVIFKSVEKAYGCSDTRYSMNIDLKDNYVIIENKQTYKETVFGDCTPDIDFSLYNLLIGKKQLLSGNNYVEFESWESVGELKLVIKVIFHQNIATVAPNITYAVLLPKSYTLKNTKVETTVQWTN